MAAEKRGATGQVKYDFNTKWSTEVQLEKDGTWYRATCRDFRSFDGPRRIFIKDEDGEWKHIEYKGPLYMYDTNKRARKRNTRKIMYVTERKVEKRQHEKKWEV
jgi:adenylate cyclase class IV